MAGRTLALPNHAGHYERALIQKGQAVHVDLAYAEDDPSADVFAHAIQGGTINGKSAQRFDLSQGKSVNFDFVPASEPGLYEVLLRRGTHEEVLQFWVPTTRPDLDPATSIH